MALVSQFSSIVTSIVTRVILRPSKFDHNFRKFHCLRPYKLWLLSCQQTSLLPSCVCNYWILCDSMSSSWSSHVRSRLLLPRCGYRPGALVSTADIQVRCADPYLNQLDWLDQNLYINSILEWFVCTLTLFSLSFSISVSLSFCVSPSLVSVFLCHTHTLSLVLCWDGTQRFIHALTSKLHLSYAH